MANYPLGDRELALLEAHCALIRDWNGLCSLVSAGDVDLLWERHVLDSLRVASCLRKLGGDTRSLLDVGSGGGYPGIVLKIAIPELAVTLVERSSKKVGFLRRVIGTLGLTGVDVVCGEFPRAVENVDASILTARAVEDPKKVAKGIVRWLRPGRTFLCQTRVVAELFSRSFHVEHVEKRFHVEHIQDDTTPSEFHRGALYLIRPTD